MSGIFNKNKKENNDKNIFIKILDWGKKVRLHQSTEILVRGLKCTLQTNSLLVNNLV